MSKSKARITVLLVDDHPVVLRGIAASLEQHELIEIVGQAADGCEALEKVRALKPDVVVTDVEMPRMDGLHFTQTITKELPATRVLVLSHHHAPGHVLRMIQSGAAGYLFKESSSDELVLGIETVARGVPYFSENVAQTALNQIVRGQTGVGEALTLREREVLVRIAEGLSNKEIASVLNLGIRTIETHREQAMRKLGIHSVAGLTKYVLAQGWATLTEGETATG